MVAGTSWCMVDLVGTFAKGVFSESHFWNDFWALIQVRTHSTFRLHFYLDEVLLGGCALLLLLLLLSAKSHSHVRLKIQPWLCCQNQQRPSRGWRSPAACWGRQRRVCWLLLLAWNSHRLCSLQFALSWFCLLNWKILQVYFCHLALSFSFLDGGNWRADAERLLARTAHLSSSNETSLHLSSPERSE